ISHSERFDGMRQEGGLIDGIQAWVAVPEANEEDDPAFTHYASQDLPQVGDTGWTGRLVAGSALGVQSPARVHSPMFYLHAELQQGACMGLPGGYAERAVYVARGRIEVSGVRYDAGRMLVFSSTAAPTLK